MSGDHQVSPGSDLASVLILGPLSKRLIAQQGQFVPKSCPRKTAVLARAGCVLESASGGVPVGWDRVSGGHQDRVSRAHQANRDSYLAI